MNHKHQPSKIMTVALWASQIILSLTFIWAGYMKLFQSIETLAKMWPWTADNILLVKLTGVLDILAGLGLILPALLNIQPKLTVYTAYATIALMLAASIFHIAREEENAIGFNIFVMALAVFIVWGLQRKDSFLSK